MLHKGIESYGILKVWGLQLGKRSGQGKRVSVHCCLMAYKFNRSLLTGLIPGTVTSCLAVLQQIKDHIWLGAE